MLTLVEACDRYLTAYNPDSLPRVALRAMKEVLDAMVFFLHKNGIKGAEILCVPFSSSPEVSPVAEQHVFVTSEKQFFILLMAMRTIDTPMGPVAWSSLPKPVSMEDLVEFGITPYQVVEGIKAMQEEFAVGKLVNMPPALA
jgi:hypothetical protein